MHAASREALTTVTESLKGHLEQGGQLVARAAQTGTELFDVVEILDDNRTLRVALANSATSAEARQGLARNLLGDKVSESTLAVLLDAVGQTWSTPREFRQGLILLGRRALFIGAEAEGNLVQVEDELFRLSRILRDNPELTRLVGDKKTEPAKRRELLANVLYGKVTHTTEALVLQVIGRIEKDPIADCRSLAEQAAEMRGKNIARVETARELSPEQRDALAEKLARIYGHEMSIHTEVDTSLLGGMVIRVGDEVIDGSTAGKLRRLRVNLG